MSEIEERLGGAFDALTATVRPEALRPLQPPRRRVTPRWAPAVAALALVAVVSAVVIGVGLLNKESPTGPASPGSRYLLALPPAEGEGFDGPVTIRDRVSGKVTQRLDTPRGVENWNSAAGTAGNRTFFLLGSLAETAGDADRLYRLHIDDRGREAGLDQVPGGDLPGRLVGQLAAAADGTRLAYTIEDSGDLNRPGTEIQVLTVATGQRRVWRSAGSADYLSLSGDGGKLAFQWYRSPGNDGVRLLDTTRPGGDLVKASRLVVPVPGPLGEVFDPWLGGRGIYLMSTKSGTSLMQVSAATGEVTRTLLRRDQRSGARPSEPPATPKGPPAASDGQAPTAFAVACRTGDQRHILLISENGWEWFDLRTRQAGPARFPKDLDNHPIVC